MVLSESGSFMLLILRYIMLVILGLPIHVLLLLRMTIDIILRRLCTKLIPVGRIQKTEKIILLRACAGSPVRGRVLIKHFHRQDTRRRMDTGFSSRAANRSLGATEAPGSVSARRLTVEPLRDRFEAQVSIWRRGFRLEFWGETSL